MITVTIPVIPFLIGIGAFFVFIFSMVDDSDMLPVFILFVTISLILFFASYGVFSILGAF